MWLVLQSLPPTRYGSAFQTTSENQRTTPMPITPLHFGILAPINHFAPGKVSNVSFILVNLLMDGNAIMYYAFNVSHLLDLHGRGHTLVDALLWAGLIALFGLRSQKWIFGAFLGGISHILLDMLVHPEMNPLFPIDGNPFYMGWMEPLSMALLPLTVWLIVQYVSGSLSWVRKRWAAERAQIPEPSFSELE